MLNKYIPNNGEKKAKTSCEGLLPGSLGMQRQVPGGCNQASTNKTPLNADIEDCDGFRRRMGSFIWE